MQPSWNSQVPESELCIQALPSRDFPSSRRSQTAVKGNYVTRKNAHSMICTRFAGLVGTSCAHFTAANCWVNNSVHTALQSSYRRVKFLQVYSYQWEQLRSSLHVVFLFLFFILCWCCSVPMVGITRQAGLTWHLKVIEPNNNHTNNNFSGKKKQLQKKKKA